MDNIARYVSLAGQKHKRSLRALIIAPTRELALQVSSHLNACLNDVSADVKEEEEETLLPEKKGKGKGKEQTTASAPTKSKGPPLVSVAAIVGGMSAQKQRRVLDRGVDVMVATPGRLWDILQEVRAYFFGHIVSLNGSFSPQSDDLASQLKNLKFLVLDEADRMIETGHFAELDHILRLTLRIAKYVGISALFISY